MVRENVTSETTNDGEGNDIASENRDDTALAMAQFTDTIFEWVYLYGLLSALHRLGLIGNSTVTGTNGSTMPIQEMISILFPFFLVLLAPFHNSSLEISPLLTPPHIIHLVNTLEVPSRIEARSIHQKNTP